MDIGHYNTIPLTYVNQIPWPALRSFRVAMGHSSYPRSAVLVLGQSSIYSLLPSTLFAQVESLLRNGRLAEAQALLERAEADLAEGSTSSSDQTLRYLHQCLAFAFLHQTRFREATTHFVKGAIDPRVTVSYFDELRPALFTEPPNHVDSSTNSRGVEGDAVEVEVWDGVREYMPDETSVDDIIATNLVRNYSPYLRPGAIPGSSAEDETADAEPSTSSDSHTKSGTRTHPATIAMREVLREEAVGMVKRILAAVLGSAENWSRDVIEAASTALALLYAHVGDIRSLLAVFAPPPSAPSKPSSRPVSRSSSRPPSRPGSTSHPYHSNGHQVSIPSLLLHTQHTPHLSQTISPNPPGPALPFRPGILAPVLSQMNLWGALVEMWKVCGDGGKVVDILAGLTEGTYVDAFVVDPLGQIFSILAPTRTDLSTSTVGVSLSLSEHERSSLVKKWAAWLAGKDVERGLKVAEETKETEKGLRKEPTSWSFFPSSGILMHSLQSDTWSG
ncbi:hypothetical protein L210DRAFT_2299991 [Boletus edulis BED1]|uniref:Uncharacterized protein n=1 Tax=Boletus edulis BED1 TaxID=1328754 RepID=A0AAD4BRE4_BOLED|nr:hypothetical protein L210DRAFT_2299991 [Boletus edulis BED1]